MRSEQKRTVVMWAVLGLVLSSVATAVLAADRGQRKFTVLLAVPVKSYPGGWPASDLPNPYDAWKQFFDRTDPAIDSFAEYWNEISYGNVNVSGTVAGWAELPWPGLPQYTGFTNPTTPADMASRSLPFADLNGNGTLERSSAKMFDPADGETTDDDGTAATTMIVIDWNGDAQGEGAAPPGPHTSPLIDGYWTPGERFRDLNGDGRYDALVEPWVDGWEDADPTHQSCVGDGLKDKDFCDYDGDSSWDFPEPFEDFMWVWVGPDATSFAGRWVRLDPSNNNPNTGAVTEPGSRLWGTAYIQRNYPGNAASLIARCGNGRYDPPDFWDESGATSKMVEVGKVVGKRTPNPDETNSSILPQQYRDFSGWDYGSWWGAYWFDVCIRAGEAPTGVPTPLWPGYTAAPPALSLEDNIPNMVPFDQDPNNGPIPARAFEPNCGGTNARAAWTDSPMTCMPTATPPACNLSPVTANRGDGFVDGDYPNAVVRPDFILVGNANVPAWYDGPAEFDEIGRAHV